MHSSAPSAAANSVLGPGLTVVATRAPASRAICPDICPTPPAPAWTSTDWPLLTRARSRSASQAVIVTSGAAAAAANDSRAGLRARYRSSSTLSSALGTGRGPESAVAEVHLVAGVHPGHGRPGAPHD